jgi:hypothetical protein
MRSSGLLVLVVGIGLVCFGLAAGGIQPGVKVLKPLNLAGINTAADELDPYLARDGKRLYYVSNASKRFTILVSEPRQRLAYFPGSERWPAGELVDGPNEDMDNRSPFVTPDGHDLYYAERTIVKAPPGQQPEANFEIVHSIRSDVRNPRQFTGPTFVQAICTEADELYPWLTEDGSELYFSRKTKDGWRLLVTSRPPSMRGKPRGAFGPPRELKEIPPGFHHATLSRDGRMMYLQGPLELGRWGLFRCRRSSDRATWSKPEALAGLTDPAAPHSDAAPCLSRDNALLYFSSDRPGGKGGWDLWVIETHWFAK